MPIESIGCTGCGSSDVKEVKANTYFCNHCESVFKWVEPVGGAAGPVACGVEDCGVLAVGRCGLCRIPFCDFHRSKRFASADTTVYQQRPHLCTACAAEKERELLGTTVPPHCGYCSNPVFSSEVCTICGGRLCDEHAVKEGSKRKCPSCIARQLEVDARGSRR